MVTLWNTLNSEHPLCPCPHLTADPGRPAPGLPVSPAGCRSGLVRLWPTRRHWLLHPTPPDLPAPPPPPPPIRRRSADGGVGGGGGGGGSGGGGSGGGGGCGGNGDRPGSGYRPESCSRHRAAHQSHTAGCRLPPSQVTNTGPATSEPINHLNLRSPTPTDHRPSQPPATS